MQDWTSSERRLVRGRLNYPSFPRNKEMRDLVLYKRKSLMDMQARNTGRAKTFSAPVGSRTLCSCGSHDERVWSTEWQGGGLGLCDKGHTCHLKCLIYQTLILPTQCGKLLVQVAMNFSFAVYKRLFHKDMYVVAHTRTIAFRASSSESHTSRLCAAVLCMLIQTGLHNEAD